MTGASEKLEVSGNIAASGNIILNNQQYYRAKNNIGNIINLVGLDSTNACRYNGGGGVVYICPDNTSTFTYINFASSADTSIYYGTNLTANFSNGYSVLNGNTLCRSGNIPVLDIRQNVQPDLPSVDTTISEIRLGAGPFAGGFRSVIPANTYGDQQQIHICTVSGGQSVNMTARIIVSQFSGALRFTGYGAGTLTTDSNGNVSASSDKRIKKNIVYLDEVESSLDKISQLKPASYQLITDPDKTRLGFIAQDVETVIPDAVDGKKYEYWYKQKENGDPELDENGNLIFEENAEREANIRTRTLDTTAILAHAVKAIQELNNKVKNLEQLLEKNGIIY